MSLIFEGKNIRKYYGDRLALELAEFSLQTGETVVVTGPNGSGKSTLLLILAFLERMSSGELRFFGTDPARRITLLLQEPYLFRDSVFRNVTLGLRLRGVSKGLQARYEAAMEAVGFPEPTKFAKRRSSQLSGGEKQRIALASRLIIDPVVLLLDEPTANVDRASSKIIKSALKRYSLQGGAIVCATHEPGLLAELGNRQLELGE